MTATTFCKRVLREQLRVKELRTLAGIFKDGSQLTDRQDAEAVRHSEDAQVTYHRRIKKPLIYR